MRETAARFAGADTLGSKSGPQYHYRAFPLRGRSHQGPPAFDRQKPPRLTTGCGRTARILSMSCQDPRALPRNFGNRLTPGPTRLSVPALVAPAPRSPVVSTLERAGSHRDLFGKERTSIPCAFGILAAGR